MSLSWWNKQFGNLVLGTRSYLGGNQGFLPDWQLKGKGLNEIFAPGQYQKGGAMQRDIILSRAGGWLGGITGKSSSGTTGSTGPWTDAYNPFKWADDRWKDADREYNKRLADATRAYQQGIGGIPQMPDATSMSEFMKGLIPPVSLTPVREGMDNFSLALAAGLGSLGQGVGGGLSGAIPSLPKMPSVSLMDEEGQPNVLVLGGLALGAYILLKKVK